MRIIAGIYKGRRLETLEGMRVRPTSDRLRETLFNIIAPRIEGARFADICAGSGAIGIEALSRGAREAIFVERARAALRALRRNLEELELEARARVVEADLGRGLGPLARALGAFGLVLADPPYEGGWQERLLRDPALPALVEPDGVLVIERSARAQPEAPPAPLRLRDTKRYGETAFDWWEFAAEPATSGEAQA